MPTHVPIKQNTTPTLTSDDVNIGKNRPKDEKNLVIGFKVLNQLPLGYARTIREDRRGKTSWHHYEFELMDKPSLLLEWPESPCPVNTFT